MASGIGMFIEAHNNSTYTFVIGGHPIGVYSALSSVVINLVVTVLLTPVFNAVPARPRGTEKAAA